MSPTPNRPGWPLYLLAGLAFLPIMGFFVGSVGLTWGLLSGRAGARRASIIAATGALLNLAGMLFLANTGAPGGIFREGLVAGIQQDMGQLVVAIEEYHDRTNSYPESLAALSQSRGPLRPVGITDMGPGVLRMRIGRNYQYVVLPGGSSYDLFSVGQDGKPGTGDDIRPLIPDSLRGRTGLKPAP